MLSARFVVLVTRFALLVTLAAAVGACAGGSCPKVTASLPRLPAFPLAALRSPHAQRAKLYVDAAGRIHKVAVYVSKAGIPAWALAAADSVLGKGEDQEYEVEQYENGDRTYEITRLVNGKKVEVSLDAVTQKPRYTEQQGLDVTALPPAVKAALAGLAGFAAERYTEKTLTAGAKLHEVYGQQGGQRYKVYVGDDGKVQRWQREFNAQLGLTIAR